MNFKFSHNEEKKATAAVYIPHERMSTLTRTAIAYAESQDPKEKTFVGLAKCKSDVYSKEIGEHYAALKARRAYKKYQVQCLKKYKALFTDLISRIDEAIIRASGQVDDITDEIQRPYED